MQKSGFYLKGTVHNVFTKQTQKGKTMYAYKVLTDSDLKTVKSMKNGHKAGDDFFSYCSIKPYVSKSGVPGLEIWENDRIKA